MRFIKVFAVLLMVVPISALSQSIECQILKEQILSEVRAAQSAQSNPYAVPGGSMLNPSLGPLYDEAASQGRIIGQGLAAGVNAMTGQPATLQDKVNLYKQRCER